MPWRLYRYIVADLLRILVLTTGVLVLVMAFGATIKPLSEGSLLGAGQIVKYICLAIVPMLQFSLPFAAGFAGTISLHRMTSDNEVLAAAACGLSYRRILTPVIGLGIVLFLIMLVLTQMVIPRFWGLLERTVAQDMTMFFQAPIQRGEAFELGDWQIYADKLLVEENPDTGADTRLILLRVVVADLDDDGRIETDVTANQIVVDIYRRTGEATWIKLVMTDTVVSQPEQGTLSYSPKIEPDAIVIPSVFEDAPARMTRPQLLALRENPDGYGRVIEARLRLARGLRDAEISRRVHGRLNRKGTIELRSLGPHQRRYVVSANRLRSQRLLSDAGTVVVEELSDGVPTRRFRAADVTLSRSASSESLGPVSFDLEFEDAEVTDLDVPDTPNERRRLVLEGLVLDGIKVSAETERSSAELLADYAALGEGPRKDSAALAARLEQRLVGLENEITARLVTRPTVSLTALLLLLLGATLAMWRRESLPLTIYLWAFLPSIIDLVMINSGEQLVRDGEVVTGIVVMWAGNGLLVVLCLFAYLRLRRN